nr:2262_t:CDS:2 [Entrophospora candida]
MTISGGPWKSALHPVIVEIFVPFASNHAAFQANIPVIECILMPPPIITNRDYVLLEDLYIFTYNA